MDLDDDEGSQPIDLMIGMPTKSKAKAKRNPTRGLSQGKQAHHEDQEQRSQCNL